ncbi:hypothetical protein L2E82_08161 [Cichorium intybus]|uniref:Uncharacterized protein n=1 Tax=Cichorium intybus TaxID=13427 RepID=A0ACB9G5T1_CICIN|nr:hypothetical protein L2E82_08161 [Cichorium intybus]
MISLSFRSLLRNSFSLLSIMSLLFVLIRRKCDLVQTKVVAAYLLALLGGNTSPSGEDLKKILGLGIPISFKVRRFSIFEISFTTTEVKILPNSLHLEKKKWLQFRGGGGGGGGGAHVAAVSAEPKKEEKVEEK